MKCWQIYNAKKNAMKMTKYQILSEKGSGNKIGKKSWLQDKEGQ